MIIQLNPPIPVTTISKGDGLAWALIDYSPEHHLIWIVAIDATGEIWSLPNPEVRAQKNITMGRMVNMNHKIRFGIPKEFEYEIHKKLDDVLEDVAIMREEYENNLEVHGHMIDTNKDLIQHSQEGIEKLFERIEKVEHQHDLLKVYQDGIENLCQRIEKMEVYIGEVKKLINEMAFQKGSTDALQYRINELEKNAANISTIINRMNDKG